MLQIRSRIGKGHSRRESGKEGLFPVPGYQSVCERINVWEWNGFLFEEWKSHLLLVYRFVFEYKRKRSFKCKRVHLHLFTLNYFGRKTITERKFNLGLLLYYKFLVITLSNFRLHNAKYLLYSIFYISHSFSSFL